MSSNDPVLTANFNFLDNVTFSISEFSVNAPPTPTISITQGTNVLLCPGSTISISLGSGAGQALWSNGATGTVLSISSPTISTYSVVAQQNCNVGTASISVTNMSITATGPTASLCEGSQATLNVTGNALSYSWTPVNLTGTNVSITTSTGITVYTVVGTSNANCITTQTVGVNVLSLPTVTISGSNTVCAGSALTLTANGASSYTWSSGSFGNTVSVLPLTTVMVCIGEDAFGCVNTDTITILPIPLPTLTAIGSQSVICLGGTVTLIATGATTYTWSNAVVNNTTTVSPTSTSVYTVTGEDITTCTNTTTISVLVNPLPNVIISSSRSVACLGERAIISVSGAANYLWNNGITSTSIQIIPTANVSFTITGTDLNSCSKTATYTQIFSQCVGIEKELISELEVFPNPNNGSFTIKTKSPLQVTIQNELGQLIKSVELDNGNNLELKIENMPKGIYFIRLETEGYLRNYKVVVLD